MKSLADLLFPITPETFLADYYGKKPLHIPADSQRTKASLLGWNSFNSLLNQTSIWTPQTLKLVENTTPIAAENYGRVVQEQGGEKLRPDPAKVAVYLARGASLIAGDVQSLTPDLSELAHSLGRAFSASAQANIYCSFKGVRAFGSHYDLTDVFAIQTEGQKLWRLYANRADQPIAFPVEGSQMRQYFEATRGAVMAEIMMQPGDVLYLPRGVYHDALAQDGASLHVTYAIAPLYGRIIFKLLEQAALQDSAFRAYLPCAEQDGGRALQAHLGQLGQRLAQLAASPAFRDEVAMAQEQVMPRQTRFDLPQHQSLTRYRRLPGNGPSYSGPLAHAMGWALSQPGFILEEFIAQFNFVSEAALRTGIDEAEQAGVLQRL